MTWAEYFNRKKLKRGQEWDEFDRALERQGQVADGSYTLSNACPARYHKPRFPFKSLSGKVVANLDYNLQDGNYVGTDTHGRKHIVQEDCEGNIVTGELFLQEIIRHVDTAPETNFTLKSATLNEYWLGGVFFNSNISTAQRMRILIHFVSGGNNYTLCANDWFQSSSEAEYDIKYLPVPMRIINKELFFSSIGSAVSVGVTVYLFSKIKPTSITLTNI